MVRRFGLVAVVLSSLVACSDAAEGDEATSQSTSEELVACGWLAGGDCAHVPAGEQACALRTRYVAAIYR